MALANIGFLPSLRVAVPFQHETPEYFGREGKRLNRIISKTLKSSIFFGEFADDLHQAIFKPVDI